MKTKRWLVGLSIAGLLFSGYLSGVKFFSNICALGESCPYFIGLPACYFGFVMYLAITFMVFKEKYKGVFLVSILGILFAGYFVTTELPILFSKGFGAYAMGLPTCAWGLMFYIAISVISFRVNSPKK